mmetsp:Transcript_86653/g.220727  ORF Transcript_86653/g.220727 Transcript_86653/m.220727 type:complete len:187 (-) Transcript_86653:155-715(-)|eukprot:CAMPEP_0183479298 /NCGR_PEP_ID=MMETSP0370-20130417/171381_1 /TAXON_ID=268820 /ORGANISM="Peridinium aciculiferum, Strain PAER-2" /LENGTH=186 /DNA_ID=CAMNT_0025672309 /DNA_START=85 /DNA_END=645 /DNA_ORIENTATION=-
MSQPSCRMRRHRNLLTAGVLAVLVVLLAPGTFVEFGHMPAPSTGRRAAMGVMGTWLVAGSPLAARADVREGFIETSSGLQYKVVQEGTGAQPKKGQTVSADYTGWLDDFESEKKFDSSRDRRQPLQFPVGVGKVIKGWDEALLDMKVGERRLIVVPPKIGYGSKGVGPIPPDSTLYFDVELKGLLR